MTIDMKWGIPLVLPFMFLMMTRLLFWMAGAAWAPEVAVVFSIFFGFVLGIVVACAMFGEGVGWHLRVGGKCDE